MGDTPKIRFKGFTDDWKQQKLSEITTSYSGGTPKAGTAEYYDGDIPFIRSGEIYSDSTELFITESGMDNSSAKMVQTGDILYALYGATSGEVSRAKLDGAINQAILAIIPHDNINADFLVEWFRKEKEKITDKYLQGGQGNLSAQIIKELKISIPSSEEQSKIGDYFSQINDLITLYQRKCDEAKKLKKYMLQKMFPQNGKKIPEIRFAGFTDDWEQRNLGEIVDKYEDPIVTPHGGYTRLGIRSHAKGTFHSYVEKGQELETAQMHRVAAGKFIVNITFGWEHAVAITGENDAGKLVSHRFPQFSFHENMVPEFFRYVIVDEKFRHHLWLASPGGAGRNRVLKIEEMLEYPMTYPQRAEQERIGIFFSLLDHLITLYQRQCDELKEIKKFMLQNMFL